MMVFTTTSLIRSTAVVVKSSTNQKKYYTHLSLAKRNLPPLNKVKYRGNEARKRAEDRSRHSKTCAMHEVVTQVLSGIPAGLRKTFTYDNDPENTLHELTNTELSVRSYFCKPCHGWEKGGIQNRKGILRRYFPKRHN
jgi:IS30 family transposase